jgi:Family of unknown function (DUF7002)
LRLLSRCAYRAFQRRFDADGRNALPEHAFHIADAENWPSIQRSGLHSTKVLIERARLNGADAAEFVGYRSRGMRLPSGVRIRDQRPMPPAALERCLDPGLSPAQWYRLVNSKVYFWLDADRVTRHLGACGARPQLVITVDLHRMLVRHGEHAFLTPFNVGNARRRPASRGTRTFVPLEAWLATRWRAEARPACGVRPRSHRPAEVAIEGSVEDLASFIVKVS